jgi:hypothetical protein
LFLWPGPPNFAVAERAPGVEEGLEWSGDAGEADWVD